VGGLSEGNGEGLKAGGECSMAAPQAQAVAVLQAGRQATQSRKAVLHSAKGGCCPAISSLSLEELRAEGMHPFKQAGLCLPSSLG